MPAPEVVRQLVERFEEHKHAYHLPCTLHESKRNHD